MTSAAVPRRRSASLSFRLVAAALVWLMLSLSAGGAVLSLAFRSAVEQEFSYRLDAVLKAIVASTEVSADGMPTMTRPLGDARFDRLFSGWYWQVTGPDGLQVRSRSLWDSVIATALGDGEMLVRHVDGPRGEPLLVVERDLQFAGAKGPTHLLVAGDLREVSSGIRRFDLLLISALGVLGIGLAVAVAIQVRFGLRPLREMAADLRAVRAGDAARLSGRYPREIAPLAEAMNAVLDKDTQLIERARAHVGNLAHGLKTSLAVIGAELQGAADKPVMVEQVQVMRRLIEHHLGRASAIAGSGRTLGVKCAVGAVAARIARTLDKIYTDRGLALELAIADDVAFRGHREDLEEILGNLMDNACKWAKGKVKVSACATTAGLTIDVEDDGPGLPADLAADGIRRGKRIDEEAPGWGLGLSIVSDLVDVNGGDMTFSRSALGGLHVSIRLPDR